MPTAGKQQPKRKLCRNCRARFEPYNSLQVACSQPCAIALSQNPDAMEIIRKRAEAAQRREARKAKLAHREANKSLPARTKEAQAAFNRYVRTRDHDQPCISCGRIDLTDPLTGGKWDCGHFLSVGAHPELRFETLNAHRQCKHCNSHLSSNHGNYRRRLQTRIGIAQLAWLEGAHELPHWRHDDLIAIRQKFERLTKELIKRREAE